MHTVVRIAAVAAVVKIKMQGLRQQVVVIQRPRLLLLLVSLLLVAVPSPSLWRYLVRGVSTENVLVRQALGFASMTVHLLVQKRFAGISREGSKTAVTCEKLRAAGTGDS